MNSKQELEMDAKKLNERQNFLGQLADIDRYLKAGQVAPARQQFLALVREAKPKRAELVAACQIARRLQLPSLIIKWLHPIVRSEKIYDIKPTSEEKSLYALGLFRVGAYSEAEEILKAQDMQDLPTSHYFLGMNYMAQWKYSQAILPFKRYLQKLDPGSYDFLVGQINLMAAYVATGHYMLVPQLAESIRERAEAQSYWLILSNCFEIEAQMLISQRRYSEASEKLLKTENLIKTQGFHYSLFIDKWKLILRMMKSADSSWHKSYEEFRNRCLREQAHETVRELDLYRALACRDEKLLLHVYHGTKFEAYRKKIKSLADFVQTIPRHVVLHLGQSTNDSPDQLDLKNGELITETGAWRPKGLQLTLLKILFSDIYRPIQLGEVLRQMYPDEHLNPFTSPQKAFQVLLGLQKNLKSRKAHFTVRKKKDSLFFELHGPLILILQKRKAPPLPDALQAFGQTWDRSRIFKAADLADSQGLSLETAYRVIAKAVALGVLKRRGQGRFRFV